MSSLKELWKEGIRDLEAAGVAEASLNAWYLLEYCFHTDRAGYLMNPDQTADREACQAYRRLIGERKKHIPLQYLVGTQEFMGFTFRVNENVLIPRQDTELLVEQAAGFIRSEKKEKGVRVLDLCTGSGCIIISLARLCPLAAACGSDASPEALAVARENAGQNHVTVDWIESDLFQKINGTFDVIVSNPPYIKTEELSGLMPEVGRYEPRNALDGKEDGLYFYRNIIREAGGHLVGGGAIFFEIGCDQAQAVTAMLKREGYRSITTVRDLAGLDRVVWGIRSGSGNVKKE